MYKRFRIYGRLLTTLNGFMYDFMRFVKFSAWAHKMSDVETRNYYLVKVYHALEKTMSYKLRDPQYGWSTAFLLLEILKEANQVEDIGFHDRLGTKILNLFINLPENKNTENSKKITAELSLIKFAQFEDSDQAVQPYSIEQFHKGLLSSPEDFFHSRFSLREFKNEAIENNLIEKAISLTIKTPSVCNRQPWHFYYTSDRTVIDETLKFQSGNRGFGHTVPNLMIITADLKAFMSSDEHYQHWIDGGMISMSVIYAFHSIGIASCCLNWSQSPKNDMKLRKKMNIKDNHTVIMLLAFGLPDTENKVCISARRPLESFYTKLDIR